MSIVSLHTSGELHELLGARGEAEIEQCAQGLFGCQRQGYQYICKRHDMRRFV
jgi:hypothetical protein